MGQNFAEYADKEQFAKAFQETWDSPEGQKAIAEKIVKYLEEAVGQEDISNIVLEKDTYDWDETAEYVLRGGELDTARLKVYWHEPGSYAPRSSIWQRVFTVPTDMLSCHPEYEINLLRAGRYGSMQDAVNDAKTAMLGARNSLLFNTLYGAVTDANEVHEDQYQSGAVLTAPILDRAINYVEDNADDVVAILGRKNALNPIKNFGYYGGTTGTPQGFSGVYDEQTVRQIMQTGKLMTIYRGVPVIGLKKFKDAWGKDVITDREVLVIGSKAGKFVEVGSIDSQEAIDVDTLMWHQHIYQKCGCAVFFMNRIARVHLTAAP